MINYLYNESKMLGSAYMCTVGLGIELERQGLLHYKYDTVGSEFINEEEFQKYPIFYIRGFLQGRMPHVIAGGTQFKATLQSESFYTRHGKIDPSSTMIREREHHFGLMITFAESDLNMYRIPTVWMPSWADTTVLDDIGTPEYDQLGFIGNAQGREDWLNKNKHGIILHKQTELHRSALVNANRYTELMNKFKILVALPGRSFNSMTGRVWEIMACRRLCLAYYNPDTMFKHIQFFKDGEDFITYQTYDEMIDKYQYYIKRPDEIWRIATNGYNKIRKECNQESAARFIYEMTTNAAEGHPVMNYDDWCMAKV